MLRLYEIARRRLKKFIKYQGFNFLAKLLFISLLVFSLSATVIFILKAESPASKLPEFGDEEIQKLLKHEEEIFNNQEDQLDQLISKIENDEIVERRLIDEADFVDVTTTTSTTTTTLTPIRLKTCSFNLKNIKNFTNVQDPYIANSFDEIKGGLIKKNIKIEPGGISLSVKNHNCTATVNLAIIIAYRKRESNLKIFLNNMHPFLTRQKINYGIYLVEPVRNVTFNRALLMNIGFVEAIKDQTYNGFNVTWNCFMFHDIDMFPEDLRNVYRCDSECPLHFAVARDSKNYSTDGYERIYFGGVSSFTKSQFEAVNGFSNLFFGWGKEDDNLYSRSIFKFGKIKKLPGLIGKYHSASHDLQPRNDKRENIHQELIAQMRKEGTIREGLTTLQYTLKDVRKWDLFTHIFVYYDQKTILENYFNSSSLINDFV